MIPPRRVPFVLPGPMVINQSANPTLLEKGFRQTPIAQAFFDIGVLEVLFMVWAGRYVVARCGDGVIGWARQTCIYGRRFGGQDGNIRGFGVALA